MNMNHGSKALLLAISFTALAGCATAERTRLDRMESMRFTGALIQEVRQQGEVDLEDQDEVVCRKEYLTGSHIAKWRCDTVAAAERASRDNQNKLQDFVKQPKPWSVGGGK